MKRTIFLLPALTFLFSTPILRGDVLYTDLASFEAATTNDTTITFTAPSPTGFTDYSSYTDAGTGTVFSIATPYVNVTGADYYSPDDYPMDFLVESSTADAVANTLTVTPPAGVSAIGFEIGSLAGSTFQVTLSDGSTFDITPPAFNGLGFFGFSSGTDITSLTLDTPVNDSFVIDEAILADTTPEPSSTLLAVTALAALAALYGRRWKRATP
jgi:hypothetical protein